MMKSRKPCDQYIIMMCQRHRVAADLDHRFRPQLGLFREPRAAPAGKQHDLHGACLKSCVRSSIGCVRPVRRASVTVGLLSLGAESNTLKRYKLSTACAVPLPIHAGLNRLDAEWSALDL